MKDDCIRRGVGVCCPQPDEFILDDSASRRISAQCANGQEYAREDDLKDCAGEGFHMRR